MVILVHRPDAARPEWTMLADTMGRKETAGVGQLVRGEHPRAAEGDDRSFGRRSLTSDSAAGALRLIVDHFAAIPAVQRSARNTARSWQLIRRELAFYPRDPDGNPAGAFAPHPDLLFALRLITNPPEMLHDFAQNRIWLAVVQLAMELTAWMQLLALSGTDGRRWEPKRLRLRLLWIAGKLARKSRKTWLMLSRDAPWISMFTDAPADPVSTHLTRQNSP